LKGPADDLGPTVRDLGDLAPDLTGLFRDLPPLIRASRTGLPDLENVLREAEPVFQNAHLFLPELNPILSLANFHQATVSTFISGAAADLTGAAKGGDRYQTQVGVIGLRSFDRHRVRPGRERGNAYFTANALNRVLRLGIFESFDCKPDGGGRRDPNDALDVPAPLRNAAKRPPCFVQGPTLYSGRQFNRLPRGVAPLVRPPAPHDGLLPDIPEQR
jgi:hypothetical protein